MYIIPLWYKWCSLIVFVYEPWVVKHVQYWLCTDKSPSQCCCPRLHCNSTKSGTFIYQPASLLLAKHVIHQLGTLHYILTVSPLPLNQNICIYTAVFSFYFDDFGVMTPARIESCEFYFKEHTASFKCVMQTWWYIENNLICVFNLDIKTNIHALVWIMMLQGLETPSHNIDAKCRYTETYTWRLRHKTNTVMYI